MGYIYMLTNKINGLMYIGATSLTPKKRLQSHIRDSRKRHTFGRPLYDALREYDVSNFELSILEEVVDIEDLPTREIFYINLYNTYESGYNATYGGLGAHYVDYALIVKHYLESKENSIQNISKDFDVDRNTIRKILNREGVVIRESTTYTSTPILQIDKTSGAIIQEFESEREAARLLGNKNKRRHIHEVCEGTRLSAYGFIWRYK